jgi:hypothetical protein
VHLAYLPTMANDIRGRRGRGFQAVLRSRGVRHATGAFGAVFLAIQFVRPAIPTPPVAAELDVPPEIGQVLRRDCYDCHSNETKVRWFDLVAPVYWKVAQDVAQGRRHLNFSVIGRLPRAQQRALLYEPVNQIKLGAMPPAAYTLVHRTARPTSGDLALLERYLAPEAAGHEPSPPTRIAPIAALPSRADVPSSPNGLAFAPDYGTWRAISTTNRFDNGTLRVILANDVAIRALASNRFSPWPDGATFAKVAWNAEADGAGLVRSGAFRQVEFMVKDAARYSATEGWGWGRWLGADLTPYGETPAFTEECTGCHAPMRADDFVFTMPIRRAAARAGLLNTEAAAEDDSVLLAMEWQVITVSRDDRDESLSMVYGNPRAIEHLRGALPEPGASFAPGSALARVTWFEREDPHWFGARIPGRMSWSRRITVGATADEQPTYECEDRGGGEPRRPAAPCPSDAVDTLLSGSTAP